MTPDMFVETPRKFPEEKDVQRESRSPVRWFRLAIRVPFTVCTSSKSFCFPGHAKFGTGSKWRVPWGKV